MDTGDRGRGVSSRTEGNSSVKDGFDHLTFEGRHILATSNHSEGSGFINPEFLRKVVIEEGV